MKKREILILALLACVNFTNIMDFMVMMPLGPQLKRVFLLSPPQWKLFGVFYTSLPLFFQEFYRFFLLIG